MILKGKNPKAKQKTILVFGTFDCLHPGHCNLFQQAAKLGKVVAIVARDTTVLKIKKIKTTEKEKTRLKNVAQDKYVFQAVLGDRNNLLKPVLEIKPDIIALGFDQKTFSIPTLRAELKKYKLTSKIIRLKSFQPKKFKSSILKKLKNK